MVHLGIRFICIRLLALELEHFDVEASVVHLEGRGLNGPPAHKRLDLGRHQSYYLGGGLDPLACPAQSNRKNRQMVGKSSPWTRVDIVF